MLRRGSIVPRLLSRACSGSAADLGKRLDALSLTRGPASASRPWLLSQRPVAWWPCFDRPSSAPLLQPTMPDDATENSGVDEESLHLSEAAVIVPPIGIGAPVITATSPNAVQCHVLNLKLCCSGSPGVCLCVCVRYCVVQHRCQQALRLRSSYPPRRRTRTKSYRLPQSAHTSPTD